MKPLSLKRVLSAGRCFIYKTYIYIECFQERSLTKRRKFILGILKILTKREKGSFNILDRFSSVASNYTRMDPIMPRPIGDHGGGRRRRTIVERNTGRSKNLICLLERGYRLGSEEGGVLFRKEGIELGPYIGDTNVSNPDRRCVRGDERWSIS